jgi:hypothetical protein
MTLLFTPRGDYLRHDTGEVGMHDLSPQGIGWAFTNQIDNADL